MEWKSRVVCVGVFLSFLVSGCALQRHGSGIESSVVVDRINAGLLSVAPLLAIIADPTSTRTNPKAISRGYDSVLFKIRKQQIDADRKRCTTPISVNDRGIGNDGYFSREFVVDGYYLREMVLALELAETTTDTVGLTAVKVPFGRVDVAATTETQSLSIEVKSPRELSYIADRTFAGLQVRRSRLNASISKSANWSKDGETWLEPKINDNFQIDREEFDLLDRRAKEQVQWLLGSVNELAYSSLFEDLLVCDVIPILLNQDAPTHYKDFVVSTAIEIKQTDTYGGFKIETGPVGFEKTRTNESRDKQAITMTFCPINPPNTCNLSKLCPGPKDRECKKETYPW